MVLSMLRRVFIWGRGRMPILRIFKRMEYIRISELPKTDLDPGERININKIGIFYKDTIHKGRRYNGF